MYITINIISLVCYTLLLQQNNETKCLMWEYIFQIIQNPLNY